MAYQNCISDDVTIDNIIRDAVTDDDEHVPHWGIGQEVEFHTHEHRSRPWRDALRNCGMRRYAIEAVVEHGPLDEVHSIVPQAVNNRLFHFQQFLPSDHIVVGNEKRQKLF